MSQKENEYSQLWRELATQVELPLAEKELTWMFTDTLQPYYWENMIGSVSSSFADLVTTSERVEEGIKIGNISNASEPSNSPKKFSRNFKKKKEGETNDVSTRRRPPQRGRQYYDQPYADVVAPCINTLPAQAALAPQQAPVAPKYNQPVTQVPRQQNVGNNQNGMSKTQFDLTPMSYTQLYAALVQKGLAVPKSLPPLPNPYPTWLNPNAYCKFHEGAAGHDLEGCYV